MLNFQTNQQHFRLKHQTFVVTLIIRAFVHLVYHFNLIDRVDPIPILKHWRWHWKSVWIGP